jgi:hypothetical protein
MKDRRVIALERVLSRRRELERKLDAALAARRAALRELEAESAARRDAAARQADELGRRDETIDTLLGGAVFRADELLMQREFRAVCADRYAVLEAEAVKADQAVATGGAAVQAARDEILRNRARVDVYAKRRDALVKAFAVAREDAEDEEASENRRPAPRPF